MRSGYSGTPLPKKLGIEPDMRVYLDGAPDHIVDQMLVPGTTRLARPGRDLQYAHLFTDRAATLLKRFPVLQDAIAKDGMLWVSWPKKGSGVATDLDENKVRDIGLACGLVDVKVCAIDDTWSGLKFVWRKKDR